MNIIYARMQGYDWVSTPSDAVARELENLGHKITVIESLEYIPPDNYDFVWSPYETVTILGDAIAKRLSIPHFSHIEAFPPWRIFDDCDIENYGLDKDDPEIAQLSQLKQYYLNIANAWKNAQIKTLSNPIRLSVCKELISDIKDIQIRYPSIDVYTLNRAKEMYSPKRNENRIVTISRATKIKRYDLLINVMNKVQTKVIWTIIGDGPMISVVQKQITNPNINLEILGALWGWNKYYYYLSSKILVYAMGGMPPIEAALCGCFPVIIENQPTKHHPEFDKFMEYNLNSTVPIFKHNQTEEMAKFIDKHLSINLTEKCAIIKKEFLNGKMGVTSSKVNAKNIIKLIKKYKKCIILV